MIIEIYKATNTINGKGYIGITNDMKRRKSEHVGDAKNGCPAYFHRGIRKHGINAFEWETIAECKTRHEASDLETTLIKKHDTFGKNGYNSTTGGENSWEVTAEVRQKMSKSAIGRTGSMTGKKHTTAALRKISEASKGRIPWNKGKEHSQETKDKIRKAAANRTSTLKGKTQSKVACPHCNKTGGNAMHRWHFDNCRNK